MAKAFDIYLNGMAKEFDIQLDGKTKEFDIRLNNRLTQCDIIIYLIPYRDAISIIHKLVLNSNIDGFALRKTASSDDVGKVEIAQSVDKTTKTSFEKYDEKIGVSADLDKMYKSLSSSVNSSIVVDADPIDLFYRAYVGSKTDLQIMASVYGTEIHFSLGAGSSDIVLGVDIDDEVIAKYEEAHPAIELFIALRESIRKFAKPSDATTHLVASVDTVIKRYRLLSELDESIFSSLDGVTLGELDYVVLYEQK